MMQQADLIGFGSLPIVVLTGFFTGAVVTLNSANRSSASDLYRCLANSFPSVWSVNWAGNHGINGCGTERFRDGQRVRINDRDRAD